MAFAPPAQEIANGTREEIGDRRDRQQDFRRQQHREQHRRGDQRQPSRLHAAHQELVDEVRVANARDHRQAACQEHDALKVQDRVIRLEERLRLAELLPDRTRPRIGELTESQLVALRFASDGESPALVEKALATGMKSKEIKKAIQNWRPDYFRV